MSVDLIALYLTLHAQCQRSPDGVYACDTARFYRDTGLMTFNVLAPLLRNGSIDVKAVGKDYPDSLYHITIKEPGKKPPEGYSDTVSLKDIFQPPASHKPFPTGWNTVNGEPFTAPLPDGSPAELPESMMLPPEMRGKV